MNAVFNGIAAAEFVADMPETLAFAPGTQYTFSLKMKGGLRAAHSGSASVERECNVRTG